MRNINIIQLLLLLFVAFLFFGDFKAFKDNLLYYYKKLKRKNWKKGI
jgi:hypothetical protein